MNIIQCTKENGSIRCTNRDHLKMCNGVLEARLEEKMFVLFVHAANETTICSGVEFQVHVWGLEKHVLWLLPPGINHCITLSGVFLDPCSNYVYAVSKTPNACSVVSRSPCKRKLLKLANALKVPVFILLDVEPPGILPVNVIPYDGAEDRCFARLLELKSKLSPRPGDLAC
ncbi:MAG: hypothetical protein QXJ84_00290 [Desulfurococcaceae archaeon]